jgi:ankyrin repeat protein
VNIEDKTGQTPLMSAVSNGHISTVKLLIRNGADINNTDIRFNYTVLMTAVSKGYVKIVEELLKSGVKINPTSSSDKTALDYANQSLNETKEQIEKYRNDETKKTKLEIKLDKYKKIIKLLRKYGAKTAEELKNK